jgi:adenylyltransferase and sulfurtransferase
MIDIPFLDLADDPASTLAPLPRDKPVFVICRFGNDSQLAVGIMKDLQNKFSSARDIKGGIDAWAKAFPTDKIPRY